VLALPGERRREKRNIRPLVSPGPSTEKSKRRIEYKKAPRFVLLPLVCWVSYFFILTYKGIVMTVSTLNFLLKMVTEKRVHDYDASM
jgi:hypothetical protein